MRGSDTVRAIRALLPEIADGVAEREREHVLPRAQVRALTEAGLGWLRVPREAGGEGLGWVDFAELLVEIAAADSNLPQIFRGHIAFVEHVLSLPASEYRSTWLERIVAGDLIGNAWSETGTVARGTNATRATRDADGRWTVSGRKFYTTGSIYADWIDATVDADGTAATALIPVGQPGVQVHDDWDGFGQPVTGTGTAEFTDALVAEADLRAFDERFRYQTAAYQLVLLTVLAGIATAVERDVAHHVAARARTYSHGNADRVQNDPQVLQVVGEIDAAAFTARALVGDVARAVQDAADTADDRDGAEHRDAVIAAEFASARAQVVLSQTVPVAATRLFDTLGASAIGASNALDRHWRNARAVASHNPWLFKARQLGDLAVNGTVPDFVWSIGVATPARQ